MLYDYDNLQQAYSDDYVLTQEVLKQWNATYKQLPNIADINKDNVNNLENSLSFLWSIYSSMSDKQKSMLDQTSVSKLQKIIEKAAEFGLKIEGYTYPDDKKTDSTDSSDKTDDSSDKDKTDSSEQTS